MSKLQPQHPRLSKRKLGKGCVRLYGDWVLNTTKPITLDYGTYWIPVQELSENPIRWIEHIADKGGWPHEALGDLVRSVLFLYRANGGLSCRLQDDQAIECALIAVVNNLRPDEESDLATELKKKCKDPDMAFINVGEYCRRADEIIAERGTNGLSRHAIKMLKKSSKWAREERGSR